MSGVSTVVLTPANSKCGARVCERPAPSGWAEAPGCVWHRRCARCCGLFSIAFSARFARGLPSCVQRLGGSPMALTFWQESVPGGRSWDGETAIKWENWDVSVPPLSSLPTAQTDNKKRPVASGRCQSAGNALVRSCCGSGHAGTQCYRGINIPRSPCHGGADPRYEIWCSSHRFTIPASHSQVCTRFSQDSRELQRYWAGGPGCDSLYRCARCQCRLHSCLRGRLPADCRPAAAGSRPREFPELRRRSFGR
jgi:hypothetical protein